MHWVFVLEDVSGRGGVESVMRLVAEEIARCGDHVTVYLPHPSADPTWESFLPEVVYYDLAPLSARFAGVDPGWRRMLGLRNQLMLREPPDLVVATHLPQTALYARVAMGYGAVPIVSWLHNPLDRFHDPELIHYADLHWAISPGIAAQVNRIIGGSRMVALVWNPIRLDVTPVSQPDPEAPARFLCIGRLENQQKRVDVCLEGLAQLNRPWLLDIIGDGPDAPMLRGLAERLGIADRCTWHGWQSDPWSRVDCASALLLTSDFEGFGLVCAEAMARGIPVVASDCDTGPADFVRHGETGWIFPKGNASALAEALTGAIDGHRFAAAGKRARETVRDFSPELVCRRMRDAVRYLSPIPRTGAS